MDKTETAELTKLWENRPTANRANPELEREPQLPEANEEWPWAVRHMSKIAPLGTVLVYLGIRFTVISYRRPTPGLGETPNNRPILVCDYIDFRGKIRKKAFNYKYWPILFPSKMEAGQE